MRVSLFTHMYRYRMRIVRASPERTAEARQFYSGGAFTFIHYNIAYKQY